MNLLVVPADAKAALIWSLDSDDYILLIPEDIALDPHQVQALINKASVEIENRKNVIK